MPEAKVRLRRCLLKACKPARISIEPVLITFYSPSCEILCIIINYKLDTSFNKFTKFDSFSLLDNNATFNCRFKRL